MNQHAQPHNQPLSPEAVAVLSAVYEVVLNHRRKRLADERAQAARHEDEDKNESHAVKRGGPEHLRCNVR